MRKRKSGEGLGANKFQRQGSEALEMGPTSSHWSSLASWLLGLKVDDFLTIFCCRLRRKWRQVFTHQVPDVCCPGWWSGSVLDAAM